MPELRKEPLSHTPLMVCLTSHDSSSILTIAILKKLDKGFTIIFSWELKGYFRFFYFLNIFSQRFQWITDFNKFPEEIILSNYIYSWIDLGYNLA